MVAAEPRLSAACSPALLSADPEVRVLRDRIGADLHDRVLRALTGDGDGRGGGGSEPSSADVELATALDLMVAGALLRAGMGHMSYDDLGDALSALAHLVIGDRA
jgi:hypothetical protein